MRLLLLSSSIWCATAACGDESPRPPPDAKSAAVIAIEDAVGRDISARAGEPAVVSCDRPALDGGIDCGVRIGDRVLGVSITMWGDTRMPQGWSLSDGSLRNERMPCCD
jgi:hypothetical protein